MTGQLILLIMKGQGSAMKAHEKEGGWENKSSWNRPDRNALSTLGRSLDLVLEEIFCNLQLTPHHFPNCYIHWLITHIFHDHRRKFSCS